MLSHYSGKDAIPFHRKDLVWSCFVVSHNLVYTVLVVPFFSYVFLRYFYAYLFHALVLDVSILTVFQCKVKSKQHRAFIL